MQLVEAEVAGEAAGGAEASQPLPISTALGNPLSFANRTFFETQFGKHGKKLNDHVLNLKDLPRAAKYLDFHDSKKITGDLKDLPRTDRKSVV